MNIDLSSCRTCDDIRRVLMASLSGKELVSGRFEARRLFRRRGIKGHIREEILFRDSREIHVIGPLHRDMLVSSMITRFSVKGVPEAEAYSYDVVTY